MRVIDASGLILGRMATKVAKMALLGEKVAIVNCEKAVVSGKQNVIIARWRKRFGWTTPLNGPFFSIMPDRLVRRAIRGMLPKKHWSEESRGRQAYGRIMCYIGIPKEFEKEGIETVAGAEVARLKSPYHMTLKQISSLIRGKNT